MTAMEMEKVSM